MGTRWGVRDSIGRTCTIHPVPMALTHTRGWPAVEQIRLGSGSAPPPTAALGQGPDVRLLMQECSNCRYEALTLLRSGHTNQLVCWAHTHTCFNAQVFCATATVSKISPIWVRLRLCTAQVRLCLLKLGMQLLLFFLCVLQGCLGCVKLLQPGLQAKARVGTAWGSGMASDSKLKTSQALCSKSTRAWSSCR